MGCGTHVAQALAETSSTKYPLGEHIFHTGTTAEGQSLLHALTAKPPPGTRGAGKAMHNLPHRLRSIKARDTRATKEKTQLTYTTAKNATSRQAVLKATFHAPPNEGRGASGVFIFVPAWGKHTRPNIPHAHTALVQLLLPMSRCVSLPLSTPQNKKFASISQPSRAGKKDRRKNTRFYPPVTRGRAKTT